MVSHNLFTLSNCDVIYNLTEQGLEILKKKNFSRQLNFEG